MGDWIIPPAISKFIQFGGGAVIVSGGSNTKGNYTQFLASIAFTINMLTFTSDYADAADDFLLDIALGAAGSEVVIVSNITMSNVASFNYMGGYLELPITIPIGSRVAVRSQHTAAGSRSMYFTCVGYALDYLKLDLPYPLTYGANTADSGGTSVDCGAATKTKGAYSQLVASTTRTHRTVILGFGNQKNTARRDGLFLVDIAIGGAGSEALIAVDIPTRTGSNQPLLSTWSAPIPVLIPAGSRLSVRCASIITDATDRTIDVIAYCF